MVVETGRHAGAVAFRTAEMMTGLIGGTLVGLDALERIGNKDRGPIFDQINSLLNALAQRGIPPEITLLTAAILSGAIAADGLYQGAKIDAKARAGL